MVATFGVFHQRGNDDDVHDDPHLPTSWPICMGEFIHLVINEGIILSYLLTCSGVSNSIPSFLSSQLKPNRLTLSLLSPVPSTRASIVTRPSRGVPIEIEKFRIPMCPVARSEPTPTIREV
jgi:hypothetical protein